METVITKHEVNQDPVEEHEEEGDLFPDLETARTTLLERATKETALANSSTMQLLETAVNEAAGPDGEVVVGLLERRSPCAQGTYLHKTFVYAGMKSAAFICRKCHPSCTGGCYGADRRECFQLATEARGHPASPGAAFVQALREHSHERLDAFNVSTVNGSLSGEALDQELKKLFEQGKGTRTIRKSKVVVGTKDYKHAKSEIISVVSPDIVRPTELDEL